ncbi:MAG: hypothetical protein EU543_05885 [Promethearchaeota archaeon]|nr:MAG: hypothetical protein EU543_05885 [Candidatus Lokiarchaeota archaeon]
MGAGKILAIIAGIVTILGTFVFALFGGTGLVGSGIGLILNIPDLLMDSASIASGFGINIILYWVFVILFIIWLASGVLQLIGIKNRVVIIIFSLFPLTLGLVFMLALYVPDIFGGTSGPLYVLFVLASIGEHYGNIFPFLVNLGDAALGVYLLIAGGVLGIISGILPREDFI